MFRHFFFLYEDINFPYSKFQYTLNYLYLELADVLIFLKVKISEKSNLLEEAEKRITELTSKVEEQQKLILKLEDDILKVDIIPL